MPLDSYETLQPSEQVTRNMCVWVCLGQFVYSNMDDFWMINGIRGNSVTCHTRGEIREVCCLSNLPMKWAKQPLVVACKSGVLGL